jgi:hypothetical protein
MPNAAGLYKQLAFKKEVTFGLIPAAAAAQSLRRVSSTLSLTKDVYQSNEIRTDMQVADMRHGVRRVKGSIAGELSCGTYKDFFAAALKRDFAAVAAIASVSLTIAVGAVVNGVQQYTVTRSAGDFIAGGVKIGDVTRLSVGALNVANINKNLFVVGATASALTVTTLNKSTMVAEGPITGCTVTVVGKKTFIPSTGHTDNSFSIEHFFSDIAQSEVYSGCKCDKIGLSLPPSGLATVSFDFMGQDMTPSTAQYFTSPTAQTTANALAAVNGILRLNGVNVAVLTGLTVEIDPTFSGDPVVGSSVIPTLFPGTVKVSGQATAYFPDATLRDVFINETEVDLYAVFTADNTNTSEFFQLAMPRLKIGGSEKNDGQGGIVQTLPFTGLLNRLGGAAANTELTTISIQDSLA